MDSPLVSIVGIVDAVGPCELGDDTTYLYLVIRERDSTQHHFTEVNARPGVSALVERELPGLFVFWKTREECRLWCVLCEDGRHAVDFASLQKGPRGS
jgi:hypothetical protein